jgi:hypothetical protein
VGALDDALGTFLHAAIAGDGDFAGGAIGPRDELPTRASAKRAILQSHAHSIRSRQRNGKLLDVRIRISSGDEEAGGIRLGSDGRRRESKRITQRRRVSRGFAEKRETKREK